MLALPGEIASALDASELMRSCGLAPDPWQTGLLKAQARRALLLCTRQAGKSTTTALYALHEALYRAPALVLLLSPSLRQSGELFRKVAAFYHLLPFAVNAEQESALQMELANGSRIISLPGKEETIRGYSGVSLLVVDEAARVPDELYYSVRPMLAVSGGRLIALSTPFGKRGWFHHEWAEGGPGWERTKITAYECPRISREFLDEERAAMPESWFAAEYLCEFSELAGGVFTYEQVEGAVDVSIPILDFGF